MHDYRSPRALGGLGTCYLYENDLAWLKEEAERCCRWMSRPGHPVAFYASDVIHVLVVARRRQVGLGLRPRGGLDRKGRKALGLPQARNGKNGRHPRPEGFPW